jgi:hypothetical protein
VLPPNVPAAAHVPARPPAPVVLPPNVPTAEAPPPKAPARDLEADLDEALGAPPKAPPQVEEPPAAAPPESEELEPTVAVAAESPPASKKAEPDEALPPPPVPKQAEAAAPSSADVPVRQVQDESALSPACVEQSNEADAWSLAEDKEMIGSWSVGTGEKLLASAYSFPKPAAAQALAGANHALAQVLAGGLKSGSGKAAEGGSPLASWAALDKTSAPLAPYRHPPGWGPQAFRGVARCTLKARARHASVAGGAQGTKGDYVGNG